MYTTIFDMGERQPRYPSLLVKRTDDVLTDMASARFILANNEGVWFKDLREFDGEYTNVREFYEYLRTNAPDTMKDPRWYHWLNRWVTVT